VRSSLEFWSYKCSGNISRCLLIEVILPLWSYQCSRNSILLVYSVRLLWHFVRNHAVETECYFLVKSSCHCVGNNAVEIEFSVFNHWDHRVILIDIMEWKQNARRLLSEVIVQLWS
jgi:hypothetical protein